MCVTTGTMYMKLILMPIDKIKPTGFNPRSRTQRNDKYLELKNSIAKIGLIEPLTIASDGTLLNGHRRLAVLIDLGWQDVPCIVRELPAQKTWLEVSLHTRPITSGQILYAVHHGLDPANLSAKQQRMVEETRRSIDEDLLEDMSEREASPFVVNIASLVCTYTDDRTDEWKRQITRWLIVNKQQKVVRWAMDSGIDRQLLISKIKENIPLTLT